jgi:hypothetical protein
MRTDPFQETFLRMIEKAASQAELTGLCERQKDWLMGLQHSEPWLYGDMADAIAKRTSELS